MHTHPGNVLLSILYLWLFFQLPYSHSDLTIFQFFDFSFLTVSKIFFLLALHICLLNLDFMANQIIYLLIHIINPFSPLTFRNNCPILGQDNHSPTLSNSEAVYAAEKIGDTRNAQLLGPEACCKPRGHYSPFFSSPVIPYCL